MVDIGRDITAFSQVFADAGYASGQIVFMGASGVLTKDADFTYDPSTELLSVGGNIAFKAGTANKGIFTHANSADRTYTLPDATGTVPLLERAQTWTAVQTFDQPTTLTGGFKTTNLFVREYDANTIAIRNLADNAFKNLYVDVATMETALYTNEIRTKGGVTALTLTQATGVATFGADVVVAGNKLKTTSFQTWETGTVWFFEPIGAGTLVEVHRPGSTADAIYIWSRLADTTTNYEYMRLQSGGGGAWTFSQLAGGSGSLRGLDFVMGSTTYIAVATTGAMTLGAAVNFGSFSATNFVAASPTFTDSVAIGSASDSAIVFTPAAASYRSSIYVRNEASSGAEAFFIATRNGSGVDTDRISITSAVDTATVAIKNADFSIGGNIFKTTNWNISQVATALRFTHTSSDSVIEIMPSGLGSSYIDIYKTTSTTDYERLRINNDGGSFYISSQKTGSGTLRPIGIDMNGNAIITFNTDNSMNFNSRAVSNFVAGSDMSVATYKLKFNTTTSYLIENSGDIEVFSQGTKSGIFKVNQFTWVFTELGADPVTANVADGYAAVFWNNVGSKMWLAANKGGVLYKVQLI